MGISFWLTVGVMFLVMFLAYEGFQPIFNAPLAAILICVINGIDLTEGFLGTYASGVGASVTSLIVFFAFSTCLAIIMDKAGAAYTIVAQEGEDIPVKGLLAYIGEPGEQVGDNASSAPAVPAPEAASAPAQTEAANAEAGAPAQAPAPAASAGEDGGRVRISPLARKTAKKMGVDYTLLAGTGPGGRIVQRDVLAAPSGTAAKAEGTGSASASSAAGASMTAFTESGLELMEGDVAEKMTGMRKTVAERMFRSHAEIPPVTQNTKADVTALLAFRKKLNEETGTKYSVNDLILKATAKCLREHEEMLVSMDGNQMIKRAHVNLGMAVALDAGLIVPVIRDADKMGLSALSERAKDLATRAKENRLSPEDYKGSTFTVSNLGMFGIHSFTPIINQPDAAILGVCATQEELAMDDDGKIFKKQTMMLSLTYDHRLIDGAVAAVFARDLRDLLQSPMNILL